MSEKCPQCGHDSGTSLPNVAVQPILDQLAYSNPETLREALRSGETVLVQCRANVGALVGTDRRVLIIKRGEAHEFSYTDIKDIFIAKVGWFLDAVCELVTEQAPHQLMKSKAADAAPNAVSLVRVYLPLFEAAKVRILEIRDSRTCRRCGAFVPMSRVEWAGIEPSHLMEPIPSGGAEQLAANLLPGERILCQAHGARFYKSIIVTDQRVINVQGRSEKRFHAFPLSAVDGVEVDAEGLQLRIKGRAFQKVQEVALVSADNGIPANEGDVAKLQQVAGVIEGLIRQTSA